MGLLVKFGTILTLIVVVNAVCTRFPLKVQRKADGTLESFCEYKAPNSPTAVKIIRGLKIQSQKCISCECTSMGLICCREDKPDPSTVPEGCMVVPDKCGYNMVLIHDRNVECLPLHMTGGTSPPVKHVMKTMSTSKYDSGSSSASTKNTKVVTESPKPHKPKHSASAHSSSAKTPGSKISGVNMAELASTISKYMQKMHKDRFVITKPTTTPTPKTTTAKPDSMMDMMAIQSFIDGGGLAKFGGIEGILRMNALGGGSLFGSGPSPTPSPSRKSNTNSNSNNSNNNNNLLDDYLTMKAMTESGALAGMGGLAGMASMAGMAGMGGFGMMG